ncbi:MAG: hypothetical protein LCH88_08665 [Proteobacteria bacterium]|nr:hypothetical protein [Pseudomonadota bacterium]
MPNVIETKSTDTLQVPDDGVIGHVRFPSAAFQLPSKFLQLDLEHAHPLLQRADLNLHGFQFRLPRLDF